MGRGPHYSGKFIARAVELHQKGVETRYWRVEEVQNKLAEEFAAELNKKGLPIPRAETIMAWARNYPDAPQRLRDLAVINTGLSGEPCLTPAKLSDDQLLSPLPAIRPSKIVNDAIICMNWIISVTFGVMWIELARVGGQN
jgi:hypothetical protein